MANNTSHRGDAAGDNAIELDGRVIAGRYRVAQTVSSGASLLIFDAIDLQAEAPVTVKIVRPEHAADEDFRRKFRRLAELCSALTHPNISAVLDWGQVDLGGESTVFWVAEALGGGSLRDLLDRGRLLTPSQVLVIGLEACRALDAAHQRGLIHTEITPSKMVFGLDRRLRVIDFGMARLLAEEAWNDPAHVPTHVARYASPEQAVGSKIGPGTDVYSLSLVLIEAVTGSVPFAADSTTATLAARVDKLMPVSADFGSLAAVLERAGRPEPADRSSAAEFGRGLVQAAEKLPKPDPIPILETGLFDGTVTAPPAEEASAAPEAADPADDGVAAGAAGIAAAAGGAALLAADDGGGPDGPALAAPAVGAEDAGAVSLGSTEHATGTAIDGVAAADPANAGDGPAMSAGTIDDAGSTSSVGSADVGGEGSSVAGAGLVAGSGDVGGEGSSVGGAGLVAGSGDVVGEGSSVDHAPGDGASSSVPTESPIGDDPSSLPVGAAAAVGATAHDDLRIVDGDPGDPGDHGAPASVPSAADNPTTTAVADPTEQMPTAAVAAATATAVTPTTEAGEASTISAADAEVYDEHRRRRGPIFLLVFLLVAGLVALGFAAWLLFRTKSFEVPDLAGAPSEQALNEISGNGWIVTTERERSDTYPEPDTVIRTIPGPGVVLDEGEDFTLVLSDGPEFRTLPELTELTVVDANARLLDLSLNGVEAPDREYSETLDEGVVISWVVRGQTTLAAGGQVLPGETIVMTVSKGPAPRSTPDLTNLTFEEASGALGDIQLEIARGDDVFSDDIEIGRVVTQTPPPGELVERGGVVTVQVSKGIDLVALPDLEGLTFAEAQELLLESGFVIDSLLGTTDGTFVEITVNAEPFPDGRYRRGTGVDVIFL